MLTARTPSCPPPRSSERGAAGVGTPRRRVVLEKPLGRDFESSREINDNVGRIFAEQQIFRIDHYLGKEAVQTLIALRFGNVLFEPLWTRNWVRDVPITIAETVGVETPGWFYASIAPLPPMRQNPPLHLLS